MAAIYSDARCEFATLVRRRSRNAGSAKLASMAVRVTPTSSSSSKTEVLAGDRVLAGDTGTEIRRVVGPERERDAGLAQDGEGVLLEAW